MSRFLLHPIQVPEMDIQYPYFYFHYEIMVLTTSHRPLESMPFKSSSSLIVRLAQLLSPHTLWFLCIRTSSRCYLSSFSQPIACV
mmetsp:Transcript_25514/g.47587  ORF Transcript_25514/g.47587 Transcript_25514/m.47587 type:complete len:85 (-) Transcript_25514:543-797(-)